MSTTLTIWAVLYSTEHGNHVANFATKEKAEAYLAEIDGDGEIVETFVDDAGGGKPVVAHTDGQWWPDDDGCIAAGAGDSYVTIADFNCSDDISAEEKEANRKLGIAAPGLLALAKQFRATIAYYIKIDKTNGDDEGAALKTFTMLMVDDAIAAAGGGQTGN